jgi:DnaJ like chaperone protein
MWVAILLIVLGILYWLSPIDLMPDVIPGWGWIDDLAMTWFLWRLWKRFLASRAGSGPAAGGAGGSQTQDGPRQEHTSHSRPDSNASSKAPHTVLGVSPDASPEEIRQAYRRLANQYHPDKVSHLGEEFRVLAEKRFKEIQEAYQRLMAGRR